MRKTRLGAFSAKIAKAKTIRGDKASKYKLFSTGAMPTLTYGHQVAGWTPVILRTVRVKAAKALGIWSAGCDLDLIWQLRPKEDPLSLVAGGFSLYCVEWWNRSSTHLVQPATLSAQVLASAARTAWQAVTDATFTWKHCRGPIFNMCLWLRLLGWTMVSPV